MGIEREINETEAKYKRALRSLGEYKENHSEIIPLTPADIELVHGEMVAEYGGSDGIRDNGLFLSACQSPYQSVFGEDAYPSVYDKAAKYLTDFARYQVFVDGNKRTALATACVFLKVNGFEMDLSEEEAYDLVMNIANGRITEVEDVSKILEDGSYEREDCKDR